MEPLIIPEDEEGTPKVVLDSSKNHLEISGVSLPEDAIGFYKPVFQWIEGYIKEPNPKTVLNINLSYFNTASSKAILDMLTLFDQLAVKGHDMHVNWHYPEMDDELLATGKEFKSMLKTSFNFVSYVQD